jgi:hypothetical protein
MRVRLAGSQGVEVESRSFTMGRAGLRASAEVHLQWTAGEKCRAAVGGSGRLCAMWRILCKRL